MNLYIVFHDNDYVLIADEDILGAIEFCYDNVSCNVTSAQFLRKLNEDENIYSFYEHLNENR